MEACCARIRQYTADLDREGFERNRLVYDATLRNLELLGEAARHVPEEARARAPGIPWRRLVAVRNILIHGYFGIDNDIIWDIVTNELAPLSGALVSLNADRPEA
jgi:uncharacterized protein with HEPN domain